MSSLIEQAALRLEQLRQAGITIPDIDPRPMAAPRPIALTISGRLMTRYWSAKCERGASGVTMPAAATAGRSISTRRECGNGSLPFSTEISASCV